LPERRRRVMPRFDFRCLMCETVVELVVTDDPFPKCKTCDVTLHKVYTPPAIHFKGGGWGGNHNG
jgi:putative FmdB family regulatory protein